MIGQHGKATSNPQRCPRMLGYLRKQQLPLNVLAETFCPEGEECREENKMAEQQNKQVSAGWNYE